jgi:hypothetical protein
LNAPDITRAQAASFTARMLRAFGGILVKQETLSHVSMDSLGFDLPALLPMDAITLGPLVYLRDGLDPWTEVLTITRECQYLSQFSGRPLEWLWFYLSKPEMRVRYIADAMHAQIELQFLRDNSLPSQDSVRAALTGNYWLGPEEIDLGLMLVERVVTAVRSGVLTTQAAKIAIEVLRTSGNL